MLARCVRFARNPAVRAANARWFSAAASEYNTLKVAAPEDGVAVITLHRPKALNALCDELISELNTATKALDRDPDVKAIVITGSEKAFAAGADITEMCERTYMETFGSNMFEEWGDLAKIKTPTIAAVRGFALGGGCELAMSCDIMIAGMLSILFE